MTSTFTVISEVGQLSTTGGCVSSIIISAEQVATLPQSSVTVKTIVVPVVPSQETSGRVPLKLLVSVTSEQRSVISAELSQSRISKSLFSAPHSRTKLAGQVTLGNAVSVIVTVASSVEIFPQSSTAMN